MRAAAAAVWLVNAERWALTAARWLESDLTSVARKTVQLCLSVRLSVCLSVSMFVYVCVDVYVADCLQAARSAVQTHKHQGTHAQTERERERLAGWGWCYCGVLCCIVLCVLRNEVVTLPRCAVLSTLWWLMCWLWLIVAGTRGSQRLTTGRIASDWWVHVTAVPDHGPAIH